VPHVLTAVRNWGIGLIAVEGVERVSAADLTTFIRLNEFGLERRIVTSSIVGRQPYGSCGSRRITLSRLVPSHPQR
jgi:hypothetical protein